MPMHSATFYENPLLAQRCGTGLVDGAEHAFLLAEYTREKGRGGRRMRRRARHRRLAAAALVCRLNWRAEGILSVREGCA